MHIFILPYSLQPSTLLYILHKPFQALFNSVSTTHPDVKKNQNAEQGAGLYNAKANQSVYINHQTVPTIPAAGSKGQQDTTFAIKYGKNHVSEMAPTAPMISTCNADSDRNEHDSESNIEDASSCASDSLMGKGE